MSKALIGWTSLKEGVNSEEVKLIKKMVKYLREECGYPIIYGQYCWDVWSAPEKVEYSGGEFSRYLGAIIIRTTDLPSFFESVAHELVHLEDPLCRKPELIIKRVEPLLEGSEIPRTRLAASVINTVMNECSAVEETKFKVFQLMRLLLKAGFKFDWRGILEKIYSSPTSAFIAMKKLSLLKFFQPDHHVYLQLYLIGRCVRMVNKRLIHVLKQEETDEIALTLKKLPKLFKKMQEEMKNEEDKQNFGKSNS